MLLTCKDDEIGAQIKLYNSIRFRPTSINNSPLFTIVCFLFAPLFDIGRNFPCYRKSAEEPDTLTHFTRDRGTRHSLRWENRVKCNPGFSLDKMKVVTAKLRPSFSWSPSSFLIKFCCMSYISSQSSPSVPPKLPLFNLTSIKVGS